MATGGLIITLAKGNAHAQDIMALKLKGMPTIHLCMYVYISHVAIAKGPFMNLQLFLKFSSISS